MVDSREFIAAKRPVELEPLMPTGTRIAFAGGLDCNDYQAIWAVLDRAHAKHPDMVLLHGASPRRRRTHCIEMGGRAQGHADRLPSGTGRVAARQRRLSAKISCCRRCRSG